LPPLYNRWPIEDTYVIPQLQRPDNYYKVTINGKDFYETIDDRSSGENLPNFKLPKTPLTAEKPEPCYLTSFSWSSIELLVLLVIFIIVCINIFIIIRKWKKWRKSKTNYEGNILRGLPEPHQKFLWFRGKFWEKEAVFAFFKISLV
jgi:hypothetical protein